MQSQLSLDDWRNIATMVSAVIALIALFRPEITRVLSRLVGAVRIYLVGETVEVGYSGSGATVAIEVTLRALSRDFFVSDAEVEVVRKKDGARHLMHWGAFRPPGLLFPVPQQITLESPAGFLLEPRNPRRLNVLFNDRAVRDEVLAVVEPLRPAWWQLLSEASGDVDREGVELAGRLFESFSKLEEPIKAWQQLQRICYWETGDYKLILPQDGGA